MSHPRHTTAIAPQHERPAGGASLAEPRLAEPADPYAGVLALQRAAGNRAVTRLLQGHTATRPPRGKSLSTLVRSALKRDGGHPLDPVTRAVMESRFRHEFSAVRLHTGAPAAKTAQTLHARAFAVGQDLFFAPGEFRPATAEGQKLLAHELAHVIQQRGASGAPRAQLDLGARGDRYEREAEVASQAALEAPGPIGERVPVAAGTAGPAVQRFEAPEHVLLGDVGPAALSRVMGLLSAAEVQLRRGKSAWRELALARDLWERNGGDPAALHLLEQATNANDEGRYEAALRLLEEATPKVMAWLREHPEAGGGTTATIGGREHPEIADLTREGGAPRTLTLRRSGVQVSYGEVLALGDFYPSPEAMHNAPREELTTPTGRGILDLIRAELAGRTGINFDQAYQEATQWREVRRYSRLGEELGTAGEEAGVGRWSYASLARRNPEHFAVENRRAWAEYHRQALTVAGEARGERDRATRTERENRAYTVNAFGDHFLTDAFAAGHLLYKTHYMRLAGDFWRANREEALDAFSEALLNDHWWAVVRMVSKAIPIPILGLLASIAITFFAPGFIRNKIKAQIREIERDEPDVILNAAVKVAHDYYNEHGVEVENRKGDRWRTFGDDHLNRSATTWQLASLAVLRSRADVTETLRGTAPADSFEAWNYVPVPPTRFDEVALERARSLIMRRRNNPLADLFIRNLPLIERSQAFEAREEERAAEARGRRERYQRYLRHIRSTHGTEGRSDSDDVAREIVASPDVYATLTLHEKAILIQEMLAGFTGDADERAILAILEEVQRRGQLHSLLRLVPVARLKSDLHGAEHSQLLSILAREGLTAD